MSEDKNNYVIFEEIEIEGVTLNSFWAQTVPRPLTLIEKMILYECDNVHAPPLTWATFWQELIDKGICWNDELPTNYARTAAAMLRAGQCSLKPGAPTPPEGWDDEAYLNEEIKIGYDPWGRPPTNSNWGRPLRWKQLQKARVAQFKKVMKQVDGGKIVKRGCAGCKEPRP